MARIIYKNGCDGQNRLACIEGMEIDLFNGQKALVYPKYAEKKLLDYEKIDEWKAKHLTEIEALKDTDARGDTAELNVLGSPAAEFVSRFRSDAHGLFSLPSLVAAMEIQDQKKEIDALAETIDGADLLRDFTSNVWSCSRCNAYNGWYANGNNGYATYGNLYYSYLAVPLVLLEVPQSAA